MPNTYSDSRFGSFSEENFHSLCDSMCKRDSDLENILKQYGYPPMWTRACTFETLIHFILEQQVSLASARAALIKLKEKTGTITPLKILALSDEELKSCYFSRQKLKCARHLAEAIVSKKLALKKLLTLPDEDVRKELTSIKGIGNWTADVYLLFALQRTDVFPTGDLAMMNAFKEIKKLDKNISKDDSLRVAEQWKPYRSIATMMMWHYYLEKRKTRVGTANGKGQRAIGNRQ